MILLDTSIWISLFNKKFKYRDEFNEFSQILTCPPVMQEVLQGVKFDTHYEEIKNSFMSFERIGSPVILDDFLVASEIYRSGRKKGRTIRSTIDCLIAAIAIREKVPVWHRDRDFDEIAVFTNLTISPGIPSLSQYL